ncbi:hypothetical protein RHMOL_Rhmol13G0175400 [Rhododendron molle]|uniref:Uncharacterized protein n=1 Tax=Rhododendron molle TaxID=49168 RepID=A0ACC0L8E0_RHOML|nr:hypothetical protein RHMOL_Rhmol13G0175400 [Rhododendron molle]
MDVQGVRYEILVKEESSYSCLEEIGKWIDPMQKMGEVYISGEHLQGEGGWSPGMAEKRGEDDDVESHVQTPTNEREG